MTVPIHTRSHGPTAVAAAVAALVAALVVRVGLPAPAPAPVALPVAALVATHATGDACVARDGAVVCSPGYGTPYVVEVPGAG